MKRMKPNTEKVWDASEEKYQYFDTRTGNERKRWWTKARTPGTMRLSRMPGGSGYRGDKLWEGNLTHPMGGKWS